MIRCWIRNSGAAESAGPFTLEELRGLVRAGFLHMWAEASLTDAYTGFRIIDEWPELVEALNTPGVVTLRGAESVRLGARHVVPDTVGPESLAPAEKVSPLKLGRVDYEDANAADKAPPVDAIGMLGVNRAAEEEAMKRFPWYRHPFWRNLLFRFMPLVLIASPLLYFGYRWMATDLNRGGALFAGGALIVIGGGYYVYFVSPSRWDID